MTSIWNKYTKNKEISKTNSKIKTYSVIFKLIIKEITYQNEIECLSIYEKLNRLKYEIKIYDIIQENNIIYVVLDNDEEISKRIDKEIIPESIIKEVMLLELGNPIKKKEIVALFEMEQAMCKIKSKKSLKDNELINIVGTGFFCEIEIENFPIKHCLFTNNHVLNGEYLNSNKTIKFEVKNFENEKYEEKEIKLNNRKNYTNKNLDYTCIEIFETDGIKKFFKLNIINNINDLNEREIFILQYPKGEDFSLSYGKILNIKDNIILHSANTDIGSSGSPIIRRINNNCIIGLHYGGLKDKFNIANLFNYILEDILKQYNNKSYSYINYDYYTPDKNQIYCIYKPKKGVKIIRLLHDYEEDENRFFFEDFKNLYIEAKEKNQNLFKENIKLYINNEEVEFDFKYNVRDEKEIKVIFKFDETKLTSTSFMFFGCSYLKSIDLSFMDTSCVTNMSSMFYSCYSLESISMTKFYTSNVNDMSFMFYGCSSLKSLNLSFFDTKNVKDMDFMFYGCSSLKSLNLSSFKTENVEDMYGMFMNCSSLESLDLSQFNISKVKNMMDMFKVCICLKKENIKYNNINNNDNIRKRIIKYNFI